MNRKNKFFTFIFSFIPGAGHMYLGFQKQGLQIMTLFFMGIFLSDWLHTGILMIFVPVVWFFSFFDTWNKWSSEDEDKNKNTMLISWLIDGNVSFKSKNKYLAYALIIIGCYLLLERIMLPVVDIYINWPLRYYLQSAIVSCLLIAAGVKLLSGSKKQLNEAGEDKNQ